VLPAETLALQIAKFTRCQFVMQYFFQFLLVGIFGKFHEFPKTLYMQKNMYPPAQIQARDMCMCKHLSIGIVVWGLGFGQINYIFFLGKLYSHLYQYF
jgi:hypothetical protein